MITDKDMANLRGIARLARTHSRACESALEVVNAVEGAMVSFATNEPDEGLDGLHFANANLDGMTDLTVRVPIRQLICEIIERLEDSNLFE